MNLVDEEDDVAAGADLFQHFLESFFEVSAVAAAGDQCSEVERVELLVGERLGHFVGHDALRETFDDGGLADARFADQHRVVLRAAGENLHDAFHLALATDDGVEFFVFGELREVATELVEDLAAALFARRVLCADWLALAFTAGAFVSAQQLDDLLAHARQIGAQFHQHLCCDAFTLTDETEQDVLGADVVVAELQSFTQRQLEHLLGTRSERDVPGR